MPLLWISIALLAGAVVPRFTSISWPVPAVVGGLCFVLCGFERRIFRQVSLYTRTRTALITPLFLLAAAFFGGMLRAELGKPAFSPRDLGWYNGQQSIILRATASQPVENHDKSSLLTVSAGEISTDGTTFTPVKGEAVILLPAGRYYAYGDRLEITGSLETPPERADFSYKQYLENRGVFSYLSYPQIKVTGQPSGNPILVAIYALRDRMAAACEQTVPQPEAAFLSGMLVGRDEDIPDGLKQAFQNTGTSHLVAISGFNITILSGLILAMTNRLLPRGWSVVTSILLLSGYAIMAGASPSVVRAAIMGALAIIGRSIGRTRTAVNSLGLAAAGMVLFNPLILQDIGFQLSVAATAGILVIGAPLNDRFVEKMTAADKPPEANLFWRNLGDFVIITLAAQAATLPLLLYHFHQYPLIGLLVNPLVLPVQPAAMILGGAAALTGMVYLPLGKILGMIAWIPLAYTTRLVELFSPYHQAGLINLHLEVWQAAALGAVLMAAVVFRNVVVKQIGRWSYWLAVAGLTVVLVFQVNTLYHVPDGRLHFQVFRQGKDLSTLILTPGGQRLLVTNRPGDKDLTAFVDRQMPVFDRRLDALILPNPTASSSIGLSDNLLHFKPEWLLVNHQAGGSRVQSKLSEAAAEQGIDPQPLAPSSRFDLGGGAILSITRVEDAGSSLTIIWGTSRVDVQYGKSTGNDTSGLFPVYSVDVLIQDHPDGSSDGNFTIARLTTEADLSGAVNSLIVPDGDWLEIRSDGQAVEILEKENGAY